MFEIFTFKFVVDRKMNPVLVNVSSNVEIKVGMRALELFRR